MSQSGVKERLRRFIEYTGVPEQEFEKSCGMAYCYVENIRQSVSPKKLMNVIRQFPELNVDWLLTGRGRMTLERAEMLAMDMQEMYEKEILARDREIERLRRELQEARGELPGMS